MQQETDRLYCEHRTKILESCAWQNKAPVRPDTIKILNLPYRFCEKKYRLPSHSTGYSTSPSITCTYHYDSHYSAAHHRVTLRNTLRKRWPPLALPWPPCAPRCRCVNPSRAPHDVGEKIYVTFYGKKNKKQTSNDPSTLSAPLIPPSPPYTTLLLVQARNKMSLKTCGGRAARQVSGSGGK